MIGSDKLATSYVIVPTIDIILDLAPLCLRDITQIGIPYILKVYIIFNTQLKFAHMSKISLNSPNNLLPVNPLIFVMNTRGCSPKQPYYFYLIINQVWILIEGRYIGN